MTTGMNSLVQASLSPMRHVLAQPALPTIAEAAVFFSGDLERAIPKGIAQTILFHDCGAEEAATY
jgi:hypothetical protein